MGSVEVVGGGLLKRVREDLPGWGGSSERGAPRDRAGKARVPGHEGP